MRFSRTRLTDVLHRRHSASRAPRPVGTRLAEAGYETDEKHLFSLDTVARLTRVLLPTVDDVLRQAAERRARRLGHGR